MAVKLADTLAPMGDFEVAEAKHVSVKIGETTKMLQKAIEDGDIGGGGAGGGSNIYSEDETVIGTWVDGRNVYRKITRGNVINRDFIILEDSYIESILNCYGFVVDSDRKQHSIGSNDSQLYSDCYLSTGGKLYLKTSSNMIGKFCIIIEYIKYSTKPTIALVPKMTSNTDPSGEVFASSIYGGSYDSWHVFNESAGQWASSTAKISQWLAYDFESPAVVKEFYIDVQVGYSFIIQYSDDREQWYDTDCIGTIAPNSKGIYSISDFGSHRYWRMKITDTRADTFNTNSMQFYGYIDN